MGRILQTIGTTQPMEEVHPETLDYLRPLLRHTLDTGELSMKAITLLILVVFSFHTGCSTMIYQVDLRDKDAFRVLVGKRVRIHHNIEGVKNPLEGTVDNATDKSVLLIYFKRLKTKNILYKQIYKIEVIDKVIDKERSARVIGILITTGFILGFLMLYISHTFVFGASSVH